MPASDHAIKRATRNSRVPFWAVFRITGFIVAFTLLAAAEEPPANLFARITNRETENEEALSNYTYRQSVRIEEFSDRGGRAGEYREARDVLYSPEHGRTEQFVEKPFSQLVRLKLTDEDFRDLREIQPFALGNKQRRLYEHKFRGEETVDGVPCWLVGVRPRQILEGQRLFDGIVWARKDDFSVIRLEGQAVPQILSTKSENLFPHFTTVRTEVEGGFYFPAVTYADDTLFFRTGPLRIKMIVRYSAYKRFSSDSIITFEKP